MKLQLPLWAAWICAQYSRSNWNRKMVFPILNMAKYWSDLGADLIAVCIRWGGLELAIQPDHLSSLKWPPARQKIGLSLTSMRFVTTILWFNLYMYTCMKKGPYLVLTKFVNKRYKVQILFCSSGHGPDISGTMPCTKHVLQHYDIKENLHTFVYLTLNLSWQVATPGLKCVKTLWNWLGKLEHHVFSYLCQFTSVHCIDGVLW